MVEGVNGGGICGGCVGNFWQVPKTGNMFVSVIRAVSRERGMETGDDERHRKRSTYEKSLNKYHE